MLISTREAARLLTTRVESFEQARHLLRTGAAGPATAVGRTLAYDDRRVCELAARPWADEHELAEVCPSGVHVARIGRDRKVDVTGSWEQLSQDLAVQPRLPPMTAVTHAVRVRVAHGLPWVATVSGLVVLGAETTGWRDEADDTVTFALSRPGAWFDAVRGRWFAFGRGRHWFFWDPWRLQQ